MEKREQKPMSKRKAKHKSKWPVIVGKKLELKKTREKREL